MNFQISQVNLTRTLVHGIETYLLPIRAEARVEVTAGILLAVFFGNEESAERQNCLVFKSHHHPSAFEILVPIAVRTQEIAVGRENEMSVPFEKTGCDMAPVLLVSDLEDGV